MAKTKKSLVEERRFVHAPPGIVFTVLSSPADMVCWLSNEARCEPRAGSPYALRWHSGYAVHGKVLAAEKARLLKVAWHGSGEPGETTVAFLLEAKDGGTEVAVRHSGFGRGAKWAAAVEESRKGWARSLECLQHVVETGIDLREAQRPMMGVMLDEPFDAERMAREGIAADSGVVLAGVVSGLSAQAAGLQARDVITSINGKPVLDELFLLKELQGHAVGDRVEIGFVRGREQRTVTLELRPRPLPDIPADHNALLATLLERYEQARTDLVKAFAGASEERARRSPSEGEWSAKGVVAHLCVTERDVQHFLGEMLLGQEAPYTSGNSSTIPEHMAAVLAGAPTVAGLLNRLAQDQADTLAIVAALRPEIIANKTRYRRIGQTVYEMADHVKEHVAQVKAALAATKQPTSRIPDVGSRRTRP